MCHAPRPTRKKDGRETENNKTNRVTTRTRQTKNATLWQKQSARRLRRRDHKTCDLEAALDDRVRKDKKERMFAEYAMSQAWKATYWVGWRRRGAQCERAMTPKIRRAKRTGAKSVGMYLCTKPSYLDLVERLLRARDGPDADAPKTKVGSWVTAAIYAGR